MGLFSKKKTNVTSNVTNETTVNVNPNIGVDIDVAGLGNIIAEGQRQSSGQLAGSLNGARDAISNVGAGLGNQIGSASQNISGALANVGQGFELKGSASILAIGLTASAGLIAIAVAK